MGKIKRNSLLSAYLANVPLNVSMVSNFFAGAVCRLILSVFISQTMNVLNVCLCAAAMLFCAAAINVTAYFMCMALSCRRRENPRADVPSVMVLTICCAAVAFVLGAAAAPQMLSLLSHG
ncbi:MAG: hypothetical protein K6B74_05665 [Ruminococcus sp.]|nr:hypothetical protein [Ruminococcus sp.]